MPVFRNTPEDWQLLDYRLLQNGPAHLYFSSAILDEDCRWLELHGYRVIRLDCSNWTDAAAMHESVARALGFPDYYGRNLDALNDCMGDLAEALGACIALRLDGFMTAVRGMPDVAHAFLDIVAGASRRSLLVGDRLLALAHVDDPRATLPPVGEAPVCWNPREFLNSSRSR